MRSQSLSRSLVPGALTLLATGPALAQELPAVSGPIDAADGATGARAAFYWTDYDLDGLQDAFALSEGRGSLLHNQGDGSFVDVTRAACLESEALLRQVAWADYDGDGWVDLLTVAESGALRLWGSDAGTCFVDRSVEAGLDRLAGVRSVAWLDYDLDGLLDLHVVQGETHRLLHATAEGLFVPAATGLGAPAADASRRDDDATPLAGGDASSTGGASAVDPRGRGGAPGLSGPGALVGPPGLNDYHAHCAANVKDMATGQCVPASSIPTLGALYPLGPEFNIHSATGRVGIGTTSPATELHVKGNANTLRLEGTTHSYMEWYPESGEPRKGYLGYGSMGTDHLTLKNEADGDLILSSDQDISLYGDVGVGTSSPEQELQVMGAGDDTANGFEWDKWQGGFAKAGAGAVAIGTYADLPAIQGHGTGSSFNLLLNPTNGNVGIGTTNPTERLQVAGRIKCGSIELTGGSDLVEGFESVDGEIDAGTVVSIDPENPGKLVTSSEAYDKKVAGVVSGAGGVDHGLRMGQESVMDGDTLVAMTGRVYVKCSAENGAIEPGDLLTSAAVAGHAMKATDRDRWDGAVIGKAMSPLEAGTGLVLVLVNLQ